MSTKQLAVSSKNVGQGLILYCVGHALKVILVAEVADIDVHNGRGLVGVGIVDQDNLQLIRQVHNPIAAVIERWGLQGFRDHLDRSMSVLSLETIERSLGLWLGQN